MSVTDSSAKAVADTLFTASLADTDPEIAEVVRLRAWPPARRDRTDRVGEHRQPRRARGAGLGADQQVRRRACRAGATTAAASMSTSPRTWRSTGSRSCSARASPTCSRIPARQANAAAFMALMQPGDTLHGAQSRRRRASHATARRSTCRASGSRWCPMACAATTTASTWTRCASSREEHKPKVIVAGGSAYPRDHRLPRLPRDRRQRRRQADGRHGAFRRAGGGRGASEPDPARACRDLDHPQDAARAARRLHPDQRRGTREEDQFGGVPGHAGRAADARHRRQGGGVRRGAAAVLQALREECGGEREGAGRSP